MFSREKRMITDEMMRSEIAAAGCKVIRHGVAWRVVGRGVDALCSDLQALSKSDLAPAANTWLRNEGKFTRGKS